jgi:hypothetical protein
MEIVKTIETKNSSLVNILLLELCLGFGLSVEFGPITFVSIELLAGVFKFHYTLTRVKHKKVNDNG